MDPLGITNTVMRNSFYDYSIMGNVRSSSEHRAAECLYPFLQRGTPRTSYLKPWAPKRLITPYINPKALQRSRALREFPKIGDPNIVP